MSPTSSRNFRSPDPPKWTPTSNPYRTAPNGQLYIPALQHSDDDRHDYEYSSNGEPYIVSPHSTHHDFKPPVPPEKCEAPSARRHKIIVARGSNEEKGRESRPLNENKRESHAGDEREKSRSPELGNPDQVQSILSFTSATTSLSNSDTDDCKMEDSDVDDLEEKKIDSTDINDDIDDFSCSPLPYG
jgi:hypothetical protein